MASFHAFGMILWLVDAVIKSHLVRHHVNLLEDDKEEETRLNKSSKAGTVASMFHKPAHL